MNKQSDVLVTLHNLFESSCFEVFESLQCQLEKVDQTHNTLAAPTASIEATSNDINIKLVLRGPVSILKKTYPAKEDLQKIKPDELDDWLSELANRFMGHLKNKLLPYEHTLQLGIPVKQESEHSESALSKGVLGENFQSLTLYFDIASEVFECSLHTQILNKDISFTYNQTNDDSETDDGELEFF